MPLFDGRRGCSRRGHGGVPFATPQSRGHRASHRPRHAPLTGKNHRLCAGAALFGKATGESIQAAVSRAEFDEVWDVLQSLQEQDEVLAEIIREIRVEKGRTKSFDDSRFRELIVIYSPQINLMKFVPLSPQPASKISEAPGTNGSACFSVLLRENTTAEFRQSILKGLTASANGLEPSVEQKASCRLSGFSGLMA